MSKVLVLNASSEPMNVCNWKRAVALLVTGKAELVEHNCKQLAKDFPLPLVIRLNRHIHLPYIPVAPTRHNIFQRDGHTCQYCGKQGLKLTLDHVKPRCQGGQSSWDNLVAACSKCNTKKGYQSLAQAGMSLRAKPDRPKNKMQFEIQRYLSESGTYAIWLDYVSK